MLFVILGANGYLPATARADRISQIKLQGVALTIIPSPRYDHFYPDRFWECQSALGPGFEELAKTAELAGWDASEATAAIAALADNRVLMRAAEKDVDDMLHRIRE